MDIPIYKTQGIILEKSDLNDTDRLLVVYTQKQGKILVRAKGIGKKESKLKSLIELFNIYEFSLARSKNIDVLAGSYPVKEFICLRQNLENLSLAIYFAELVDKLVVAPERDDKIWALLTRAVEVLNERRTDLRKVKTAFEEKLIEFLGHPNFKTHGQAELGQSHAERGGKTTEREKLNYLQSLAGEEIKSEKFLKNFALI